MRRKIIIILSVLTISMCLGACGNKEVAVESTETTVVATPEPTVEPTPEPTPTPTPEPSNEFASVEEIPVEYLESMAIEDIIIVGGVEFICTEPCKATNETNYLALEEVEGSAPVVAMYDVVTVVETVEFDGKLTTGTETRYSDGTSDYEVFYKDPDLNKTLHFIARGITSGLVPKDAGGTCLFLYFNENDPDVCYKLTVGVMAKFSDYKNYADESFEEYIGYDADGSTFQRIETEEEYKVYLAGKHSDLGIEDCTSYTIWMDNYITNQSYKIMARGIPQMDRDDLLDMINNVEIISFE